MLRQTPINVDLISFLEWAMGIVVTPQRFCRVWLKLKKYFIYQMLIATMPVQRQTRQKIFILANEFWELFLVMFLFCGIPTEMTITDIIPIYYCRICLANVFFFLSSFPLHFRNGTRMQLVDRHRIKWKKQATLL